MKQIIKYSLIFLSYFFYNFFILLILNFFKINISNFSVLTKNIYLFVVDFIYIFILWLFIKKDLKIELNNFKKNGIKLIIKFFPIYLFGVILMGISNSILISITGLELSSNEENVRTMIKFYPFYMFFSSVIYAPFVEEVIFRKSIKKVINNETLFILLSGLIFGLIHVISGGNESINEILMGIPYIIMGIDFAYIFYKSENIFTTMALHSLHNLILIIIQLIGG